VTNSLLESACFVQGTLDACEYLNRMGKTPFADQDSFRRLLEEADNLRRFVLNCNDNVRVMGPEEFAEWVRRRLDFGEGV
jgi:DNA polymerase III delta prime subunit